jgi:hypothetical protein
MSFKLKLEFEFHVQKVETLKNLTQRRKEAEAQGNGNSRRFSIIKAGDASVQKDCVFAPLRSCVNFSSIEILLTCEFRFITLRVIKCTERH